MRSEAECIKNNVEFIILSASGCICKQTKNLKVTNSFIMQSEFTALQGAIHDLKNIMQEFE